MTDTRTFTIEQVRAIFAEGVRFGEYVATAYSWGEKCDTSENEAFEYAVAEVTDKVGEKQ